MKPETRGRQQLAAAHSCHTQQQVQCCAVPVSAACRRVRHSRRHSPVAGSVHDAEHRKDAGDEGGGLAQQQRPRRAGFLHTRHTRRGIYLIPYPAPPLATLPRTRHGCLVARVTV